VQQPCSNAGGRKLAECFLQGFRGPLLHVGEYVRVGIEGDSYGGVSEHLGDDLRVDVPRK